MNWKNAYLHFKKICIHKYWVFVYCHKAGITWRWIKHDLSKFNPIEFVESVKYYQGNKSPIDACKKDKGVSYAWMHHKGRNDHHYEYWQDNFDNGGNPVEMPYDCAVEMLCDYIGAAKAYLEKDFSYRKEFLWFIDKLNKNPAIHIKTAAFIYSALKLLFQEEALGNNPEEKLKNMYLVRLYVVTSEVTKESFAEYRAKHDIKEW